MEFSQKHGNCDAYVLKPRLHPPDSTPPGTTRSLKQSVRVYQIPYRAPDLWNADDKNKVHKFTMEA
jgi:hypothetical protein